MPCIGTLVYDSLRLADDLTVNNQSIGVAKKVVPSLHSLIICASTDNGSYRYKALITWMAFSGGFPYLEQVAS